MKFTRRDSVTLLVSSLLIGVFSDSLARQSIFGLNFLIWTALWVGVLYVAGYLKHRLLPRLFIFGGLALLNAVLVYVRAEPVVQAWSVMIALVLLLLMTGMLYAENFLELTLLNRATEYLTGGANSIITNCKKMFAAIDGKTKRSKPVRISSGIIIAIILGLIFIGLFSGSDEIFRHQFAFIGNFFRAIGDWLGHYNTGRVITIAFWVCFALAALLAMIGRITPAKARPLTVKKILSKNDPVIILGTLCAVFGIFILIQIKYLFAGSNLPNGLTYAEYARRGYGELLLATLFASGVIYATISFTKEVAKTTAKTILSNALVILNGIVVLSAWKRLSLYESAYGWTMSRFVARLGLICILLGSLLLLLWVNRMLTTRRLFGYSWYLIAVVLTVAALLNPVGTITGKNITERGQREVPLDTGYINSLSADSYLAICKYAPALKTAHPLEFEKLHAFGRLMPNTPVGSNVPLYEMPPLPAYRTNNHGLSAHYTLSETFKHDYNGCL